jgi:hydroxymethylbilane synthase
LKKVIKIGTRESQLAVWQATLVKELLGENHIDAELVFIKSEGDVDTDTPLYELGVQGIFTKTLDAALLNKRVDIAVHSLKDVPTKLADGIVQAAVLKRGSSKDILVYHGDKSFLDNKEGSATIATSSIRRKAQWLHRFPHHTLENLRGNVNTRLRKIQEHHWTGAIFAGAGLERIKLRPANSLDLDWMLPAPGQGAITIVCRREDSFCFETCHVFNDAETAMCTSIERDFLRKLQGGCSTPISALAAVEQDTIVLKANICSPDGRVKVDRQQTIPASGGQQIGIYMANEFLKNEQVLAIMRGLRNAEK